MSTLRGRTCQVPFVNLGAVACIQSHAKALRRLLETDAEAALILKDDAELAVDVPTMCEGPAYESPPGPSGSTCSVPRS